MDNLTWVVVPTPAYAGLDTALCYQSASILEPGTLVRVPLGARDTLGVVWDRPPQPPPPPPRLRPISAVLHNLAPLTPDWRQLVTFCAHYYQRSVGEVALAALPAALRDLQPAQVQRRLARATASATADADPVGGDGPRVLNAEQQAALDAIVQGPGPFLLFGVTGSGKTEVYLQAVQELLKREASAQALVLVPEINLTPQLEQRIRARFAPRWGQQAVVTLHSGLTPAQRLRHWLAAHNAQARVVLGTRLAVLASLPRLRLIVVDEEHDPSYKSGDGARYSARDLAVYRAHQLGARVVLGSATPSLESWHQSRSPALGGRYRRLPMHQRAGSQPSALPPVRLVSMKQQPAHTVVSAPLLEAMQARIARGEQCLVYLNRRGWAPVLHCPACGWKSQCPHCSAFRVFHKVDRTLRCHHCALTERVPRACPECGNLDIDALGRGTERVEEHLSTLLAPLRRPGTVSEAHPDGLPVRVARIDADTTRRQGALEQQLAAVHDGAVDVLVGTQMIAKGHDFRRITLVAALNPDSALFSSDYRASERLFSLLLQAGGRAGREASLGPLSEVWIQTYVPEHPLFDALRSHDFPGFAARELEARARAGMPPFVAHALLIAQARSQETAQAFLNAARALAQPAPEGITLYAAIPMPMARVANVERAQMLVECPSRAQLQRFLAQWQTHLHALRQQAAHKGVLRWSMDVDPLAI